MNNEGHGNSCILCGGEQGTVMCISVINLLKWLSQLGEIYIPGESAVIPELLQQYNA